MPQGPRNTKSSRKTREGKLDRRQGQGALGRELTENAPTRLERTSTALKAGLVPTRVRNIRTT